MENIKTQKSWVSKKMLGLMTITWFLLVIISIVFHKFSTVVIISIILSVLMTLLILYFSYAYYKLSPKGGNIQSHVSGLVTERIDKTSTGRLLDIGCGSGILSVELALKCPDLKINAIDYWGSMWGYSKEKCERLAKDYKVSDRISFERASASSLPFDNEIFDIVISNMVFHEVADTKDKREVIKEALRVLKEGGQFVFQDLLLSRKLYGNAEELIRYIKDLGIENVSLIKTKEQINIPYLLNGPMFFGDTAMLVGKK